MSRRQDISVEGAASGGPGRLVVELVPIDSLALDPVNARDHSDPRGMAAIRTSLERFGQRKPIVVWRETPDSEAVVTKAGNGVLGAARDLGWTEIWVAWADGMTRQEADAFGVADNAVGTLSSWNFPVLADVLRGLDPELQLATGFDDSSIAMLLQGEFEAGGPAAAEPLNESAPEMGAPVKVTAGQREVFERACAKVREQSGDPEMTEGRCLEMVCGDYLAGA